MIIKKIHSLGGPSVTITEASLACMSMGSPSLIDYVHLSEGQILKF